MHAVVLFIPEDREMHLIKPKEEDMDKCRFWMKVFGLEGLEERGFLKLSSGEQRLVQ